MNEKSLPGMFCGILTGFCWGLSGIFSQYLFMNTDMQSGWFVAVRMLVAGVFMIVCSFFVEKDELILLLKNMNDLILCAVTGVFGTMLFQFFCYGAVQRSNAATAIVLQYLCPVFVMIFTCIKEWKHPKGYEIIALLCAVSGIFLIATHGNIHELVITKDALLWGIGCAFFMSLTTILPERLYKKYSTQTITSVTLLFGGLVAAAFIRPWVKAPELDMKAMLALFAAVLCGSMLAYIVYGVAIKYVGTTKASLYACAEIPTATILSVVLLNDSFMWMDILGFILIGSTIFILSAKK